MLSYVPQVLAGGILLGGIYGFAAFGLSITFGVLNILNLAHGDFLMLGSLMGYLVSLNFGVNPFIIALIIIPIFVVIGVGFHLLLLRPISDKPPNQLLVSSVLITLGASIAIEDLTSFFWPHPITGIEYSLPSFCLKGLIISKTRLLILLFLFILAFFIHLYLRKTHMGKSIRAITQCRGGAKLIGVPISRISALTFGLGIAIAASAGVFYITLFTVTPVIGMPLTVKCMCIVVLGGLGSLTGSAAGGITLGLAESLTAYCLGAEWSPAISLILLILILLIKPEGLFGRS
jgi:branched-chain amino acid transport system permease protein